ncbi:transglutaminase-like domain-containing protein [Nocardiopsis listeri]|uniref:transglutaminase-like domain-containing protein n=1 Tax=Nocardiopsis listeri TaxID=53440 RepID=UPI00082E39E6|nr:transglutaminase domain-containing protein [Nocardiopsis listeri]
MATVTTSVPEHDTPGQAPTAPVRGAWSPSSSPRALLAPVGPILATTAGGVALASSYASPGPFGATLVACAIVSVVLTLLLRSRFSALRTVLLGVPVPLAAVPVSAAWSPGEGEGVLHGAGEALLHSGARILTSTAPTPLSVDTLTLPLLATWLTGTATALAWRAERRGLVLMPGLLLLVGAVVINGPVAPPGFPAIALTGVAAVLVMSVRSGTGTADHTGAAAALSIQVDARPSVPSRVHRAVVVGSICVLTATIALVGGPRLLAGWETEPGDPRTVLTPPMDSSPAINPLGYLAGWAAEPDEHLLTVESDRPVELRWAALADFTGTTWLPESGYRKADGVLPAPVPPPPGATPVSGHVRVGQDLPGAWAPVIGAPRRVGLDDPGYDARTGTVATMDGPIAEQDYEVVGEVADWDSTDLTRASPPAGDVYDDYRELPPGAPAILNDVVASVAAEGPYYQRATALARYLRESHSFDPHTPGGHSYAHIDALLAAPGGQGGGGTSEQFASAFAMLARAAGLPSRVAVGFAPGTDQGGGEYEVRSGDAVAWGEVYFDGVGWVPFAVTPGGRDEHGTEDTAEQDVQDPEGTEAEDYEGSASDDHAVTAPGRDEPDQRGWTIGLTMSGCLLTLFLSIPLGRMVRTRIRLGSGPPNVRVLGAWRELLDGLRQASVPLSPGSTVSATVAAARDRVPGSDHAPGLDRLAHAVNSVGFGAGRDVDDAVAHGAATTVRTHLRSLRATRPRIKRLTWWFDPRPLLWRDRGHEARTWRGQR